jgi:hypothetical protein
MATSCTIDSSKLALPKVLSDPSSIGRIEAQIKVLQSSYRVSREFSLLLQRRDQKRCSKLLGLMARVESIRWQLLLLALSRVMNEDGLQLSRNK